MPFLIFQVPYLGNGMVIGVNAVVHVIISHGVAIGFMAMIVVAEYFGVRKGRPEWENQAERMLKPAVIVITGVGAVTGAGIWFTTSALNARGIGSMLRIFFWPWFLEWIVFTIEVAAILVYYLNWNRWRDKPRRRLRFGAAYVALASVSAFLITGILGFMLTPDGWPWNGSFISAFFNASFIPQLFLRLAFSLSLGALFALAFVCFARFTLEHRTRAVRLYGRILLAAIILSLGFTLWYFSVVPSRFKAHAIFSILTSHLSQQPGLFWLTNGAALLVILAAAAAALAGAPRLVRILIIPGILVAAGMVTEYERVREFIRGPYIMPGYMYSNQILLAEREYFRQNGLLENSPWFRLYGKTGDPTLQAVYLFKQNCSSCHTIGGLNDISDRVRGRSADGIFVILGRTQEMVPFMAPFSGTDKERRILADFLFKLATDKTRLRPYWRPFPTEAEARR